MASGPIVGGGEGDGAKEKKRYSESKVYTRKTFKGPKKNNNVVSNNANTDPANSVEAAPTTSAPANSNETNKDNVKNNENSGPPTSQALVQEDVNSPQRQQQQQQQQQSLSIIDRVSDEPSSPSRHTIAPSVALESREQPAVNGSVEVEPGLENRVKMNVASRSKQEMLELRKKLEGELEMVRSLVKKIEAKQGHIGYGHSHVSAIANHGINNGGVKRAYSEAASVGVPPREATRSLHQLTISLSENNSHGMGENVEKEKRMPKANQFYRNSEFLLAKDKFPPADSNKKSKLNGKKQGGRDLGNGFGMGTKFFKSCSSLLEKLMKHNFGWVFNEPVDAGHLGLHDYHIIIKHPMDLGTIKLRLNKNWYKSPKEFAEDVRLTFRNAMTYNPKGQDVHAMAETLSKIFEERWAIIESDYNREMRFGLDYGVVLPTPISRKASVPPPPLDIRRILDRSESMTHPIDPKTKPMSITPTARTPALKKPKAKDLHKRDMTYEEKQKLSTNLQSLPSEKLDAIVQIIKKRNSSLFQHDDEIEVDIDNVDAETLWELDRFVTNYKKSLSKNKRKAELAIQARAEAMKNVQEKSQAHVVPEIPKETNKLNKDDKIVSSSSPVQGNNQGDNKSRSSSSGSSSSDSGSSSSDSDSDSSSASGSDTGSPRT